MALQQRHNQEGLTLVLAEFVDRADIGMFERGSGTGFECKALQRTGIGCCFLKKEFQSDLTAQPVIFGAVHEPHAAAIEAFEHFVVANSVANQRKSEGMEGGEDFRLHGNRGGRVGGKQCFHFAAQVGVMFAGMIEKERALVRLAFSGAMKEILDLGPALRIQNSPMRSAFLCEARLRPFADRGAR